MKAPTKECPYCHKQVDIFGLNYVHHIDKCKELHNPIERAYNHSLHAHPECQCSICTMGFDAWLFNYHPSEY